MRRLWLIIPVVIIAFGVAACSGAGSSETSTEDTDVAVILEETPTEEALLEETPEATPEGSPTVPPTPTPTRTPAPTPTPIAPSSDLAPLAGSLEQKVLALRDAVSAKDLTEVLRLQSDVLIEADKAEKVLQSDKSKQAGYVRSAVSALRDTTSGNFDKSFDSALTALAQALGKIDRPGTPSLASKGAAAATTADPAALAKKLSEKADSFKQGLNEKSIDTLMRRQREMMVDVLQAETALGTSQSSQAETLRAAVASLKRGLTGDAKELDAGLAALKGIARTEATSEQPTDLQAVAESLNRKLEVLIAADRANDAARLLRAQRDLTDDVSKAEALVKDGKSRQSEALRSVVMNLRSVLAGDTAKIPGAKADLDAVLGRTEAAQEGASALNVLNLAQSLQDKVDALNRAVKEGNSGDMLRLQTEILDLMSKGEVAVANDQTNIGLTMKTAFEAIRNGLGGDLNKFSEAANALAAVSGIAQACSTVPSGTTPPNVTSLNPIANGMGNTAARLADAVRSNKSQEEIARIQAELSEQISKAEAAIKDIRSSQAERLRAAFTAAREAAGGDFAKVDRAIELFRQAETP